MIVLNAYGMLKPGTEETMLAASRRNKAVAVTEPGCERFDFFFSPDNPLAFVFVEEWSTLADLQAHFAQPNFGDFMAALEICVAAAPEIRIFEATLLPNP